MRIESNITQYVVTRRNLYTGKLEILQSCAFYGRDGENVLRTANISWNDPSFINHSYYMKYAERILESIKKYHYEDGYYYSLYEVKQYYEITPTEKEEYNESVM